MAHLMAELGGGIPAVQCGSGMRQVVLGGGGWEDLQFLSGLSIVGALDQESSSTSLGRFLPGRVHSVDVST